MSDTPVLYVSRLADNTTEDTLHNVFSVFGTIKSIKITKNYAFITYRNPCSAFEAKDKLQNHTIDGHRIIVDFSKYSSIGKENHLLFLKRVPSYIRWTELKELFLRYVSYVYVNLNRLFGELRFASAADKERIITYYEGHMLKDYKLKFYRTLDELNDSESKPNIDNNRHLKEIDYNISHKRDFSSDSCECSCHFDSVTLDKKSNKLIMLSETHCGNSTMTRTIEKKRKRSKSPKLTESSRIKSVVKMWKKENGSGQENKSTYSQVTMSSEDVKKSDKKAITHNLHEINSRYECVTNTVFMSTSRPRSESSESIERFVDSISREILCVSDEEDYEDNMT